MKHLKLFEDFAEDILSNITDPSKPKVVKELIGTKDKETGREIKYALEFDSLTDDDSDGLNRAENFLKSNNFVTGSMYMGYPIGFKRKDGDQTLITDKWKEERPMVICKWDRLYGVFDQLDGCLYPKDFTSESPSMKRWRGKPAIVVFFIDDLEGDIYV